VGRAYRDAPCAFCELASGEYCPRCQLPVCSEHGLTGEGYCGVCAKELEDDLEVASFDVAVHDVPPDSRPLFRGNLGSLLGGLASILQNPFRRQGVWWAFHQRSPEEIAAWRRRAGVRVRNDSGR
jgi:hypothetical protein